MKRIVTISFALFFIMSLSACNSSEYEKAKAALESGNYNSAIFLLEDLAEKDYEDSKDLLLETKYLYVKSNYTRNNPNCLKYLDSLIENDYKDSQKLYDDLFSWKVDIAISTYKQSHNHCDVIDVRDQLLGLYYFNFRTYDGPKNDEFNGKYEIVFSNGKAITDNFIGADNNFYFSVTLSAIGNPKGKTTFNVYGEDGNLLATKTSIIK